MKFGTRLEAFNFLKACDVAIRLHSVVVIPSKHLELFDIVEYPTNE